MTDLYLYRNSVRDLIRPKRVLSALALIVLPSLIAVVWRGRMQAEDADIIYDSLTGLLIFGFLLVILALVFASGAITQEIEQKTITYLLTRPVPRWRILLSKFAAALTVTTVTAWLACGLLALTVYGFGGTESRGGAISKSDITDLHQLVQRLTDSNSAIGSYVLQRLPDSLQAQLALSQMKPTPGQQPTDEGTLLQPLADGLDGLVHSHRPLYDDLAFADVKLSAETRELLNSRPPTGRRRARHDHVRDRAIVRLNRRLLVESFPGDIASPSPISVVLRRDCVVLLVGAVAYGSAFLLLATFLTRPLLWGLLFAFGWESWVPDLPGNWHLVSLMSYVRVLAPHPQPDAGDQSVMSLFGAINPGAISPLAAWLVLAGCIGCCLGLAISIFSTREYVPRDAE